MSDEIIRINESERMFIALPVPEGAVSKLEKAVGEFGMYLESNVPIERWHMTMFFLPTLHITYVGRGEKRDQLWAIAEKSQSLKDLRMEIIRKLRKLRFPMTDAQRKNKDPFVPHVRLAKFNDVAMRMGLADSAINSSFAIKSANVYISRLGPDGPKYYCVKSMSLTS